jgi:hypothetical protein
LDWEHGNWDWRRCAGWQLEGGTLGGVDGAASQRGVSLEKSQIIIKRLMQKVTAINSKPHLSL